MARSIGQQLNEKWGVHAQHALYRADGTWYHLLERFPGALFDTHGYVLFKGQEDVENHPGISLANRPGKNWLSVPAGIASLPEYVSVEPGVSSGKMEASGYWIFACNPRMWAIDRFMRDRLPTNKDDGWGIRPSDARSFAPGQFGFVRVGNDTRTKDQRLGAPRLQAGIYALCQVLSEPFPGTGGDDDGLWSANSVPPPGRPTVHIRYLWHSLESPLSIAALKTLRPDFNRHVLDGLQARSFPLPEDDFWFIVDHLGSGAVDALEKAASSEHGDAGFESEALLTRKQVEEGYDEDRTRRFRIRNAWIIAHCKKRDNYTCQACQFRLDLQGVFIVDCHHKNPLGATDGARITKEEDLICLCPTCHRIAHTGKPLPLGIEEIRKARGF